MFHFWTAWANCYSTFHNFVLLRNKKKILKFFKHQVLSYMVPFLKDGIDHSFKLYLIISFGAIIWVKNIFFLKTFTSLLRKLEQNLYLLRLIPSFIFYSFPLLLSVAESEGWFVLALFLEQTTSWPNGPSVTSFLVFYFSFPQRVIPRSTSILILMLPSRPSTSIPTPIKTLTLSILGCYRLKQKWP